ncbi:carboxypeptidase-like regulatory domain-containing protein [Hymenobacter weizhouensis]|uniref:carboxypeptidase-like regulatory domain-containing protein n=1 Tax=Hymenobacter sp. YIM 151500-1 TaxID=2987689 RepID=UPI002227BF98|nr:carboxypeptidase-like regulatory domain-containing protein [Hymenobacter sp. YIM 151500-1]UYZ62032.1 carboxypeptidase-like regulatory domain-containing protein [Hymenobacter sp. YIM 151500-1]
MKRFLLLASFAALLTSPLAASAQRADATPALASERIALAEPAPKAAPAPTTRLGCAQFSGQVLNAQGQPLVGATVMLEGSRFPTITNSEGKYLLQEPVYQGQVLHIAAAGYVDQNIVLNSCEAPVVGLELAEGTRVKRNGKRAGQIVRFGQAYRQ